MPNVEVVDEVIATGGRPNGPTSRRGVVNEVVRGDGGRAVPEHAASGGGVEEDSVSEGGSKQRAIKESTQKLLDVMAAGKPAADTVVVDSEAGDGGPGDPDDVEAADAEKTPAKAATEEKPPGEMTADEKPPAEDVHAEIRRYQEANRQLVAELEDARRKPPRTEPSEREKILDEVERTYLDDPIAAVRRLIGAVLGTAQDSKDVDEELAGLYTDLTSRELKVPLEAAHKAAREAARARQMLARDKRERKAESDKKATPDDQDDVRKVDQAATFIGSQLSMRKGDGKSVADDYPLLMTMSEELDGMKPEALLWKVIERETKAGNLSAAMGDDKLIAAAAQRVENYYQSLSDKFGRAKPKIEANTTKQDESKTTADKKASNDTRQSHGARTITNAAASVAPATSPAKKPEPSNQERPKFKSDKERREWALRHIPT